MFYQLLLGHWHLAHSVLCWASRYISCLSFMYPDVVIIWSEWMTRMSKHTAMDSPVTSALRTLACESSHNTEWLPGLSSNRKCTAMANGVSPSAQLTLFNVTNMQSLEYLGLMVCVCLCVRQVEASRSAPQTNVSPSTTLRTSLWRRPGSARLDGKVRAQVRKRVRRVIRESQSEGDAERK